MSTHDDECIYLQLNRQDFELRFDSTETWALQQNPAIELVRFSLLDDDGSGDIDAEEICGCIRCVFERPCPRPLHALNSAPRFRCLLGAVKPLNAEILEEFVEGLLRLKGPARAIDLAAIGSAFASLEVSRSYTVSYSGF